ncbi:hypothetical protein J6590_006752 [Homalodisca vitripennis]|nr:hypothetical protein J6590_006752 [Homalodisca vitripennis]
MLSLSPVARLFLTINVYVEPVSSLLDLLDNKLVMRDTDLLLQCMLSLSQSFDLLDNKLCMLSLSPQSVAPQYRSGATMLSRPVSSSKRQYDTDKTVWPVNKPVTKVEAIYQCSGEAQYVDDIPELPGELHGALVLTTVGQGTITSIDSSQAMSLPGVVAFYSAKDIPGVNSFTSGFPDDEPVFCDDKVLYCGQPVGLVVAETQSLAKRAAAMVQIQYSNVTSPVLDMKLVIANSDAARIVQQAEITPAVSSDTGEETISVEGSVDLHEQYHLTMELQTCVCVPIEDGLDLYSSTQWMEHVHNAVSRVLAMPAHRINMKVRRLGGGYGAKLTRSTWVATQCAVAAKLSNRPVRLVLNLQTNMETMGKRYSCFTNYKANINKTTGKIVHLEGSLYEDAGWSENDPVVEGTLAMLPSAYDASTWNVKGSIVKTDKASNTWCRSPGSTEAIGTIEVIMDNIACTTGLDPIQVRLANMVMSESSPIPAMVEEWRKLTDYDARLEEINKFNQENCWKQRGISLVPMTYKLFLASRYNAAVTIYPVDSRVAVMLQENCWKQRGISLVPMTYKLFLASRYNAAVTIYPVDSRVAVMLQENCWKQRGISLVPMTYKLFLASRYNAAVTIYPVDSRVAVMLQENCWKEHGISLVPMTYKLFLASRYNAAVTIYPVDSRVAVMLQENCWKQRGISLVPMTYKLFLASRYNAAVTIYPVDSRVAVMLQENCWKERGISLVPMTYKLFLASRYNAAVTIYPVDSRAVMLQENGWKERVSA